MEAPSEPVAPWVQAAISRDEAVAERWRAALEAEGIEAEIRLEDAQRAVPGSSPLPGYLPPAPPFAYAVFVPRERLAEARRVLVDHGWDGRYGQRATGADVDRRTLITGALLAVAAAVIVIIVRVLAA